MRASIRLSRVAVTLIGVLALGCGGGDNNGTGGSGGQGGGKAGAGGKAAGGGAGGATTGTGGGAGTAAGGGAGKAAGGAAGTAAGGAAGTAAGGGAGTAAGGGAGKAAGGAAGTAAGGGAGTAAGGGAGKAAGGAAGTAAGGGAGTAAGGGAGSGSRDAGLDLSGVSPPLNLTASVKDRRATTFELVWTAPSVNGQPATGYQVRYATVPITSTNFNDTTVTTAVTYNNTPAAPGNTDGMTVTLYIETDYYFAVQGTNSTGGGTIDATTTPTAGHFLMTTLAGASGDRMGYDVDGAGDFGRPAGFSADGLSDLIVGAANGQKHAYLFFGTSDGYSTTPSVTFTGTVNGFGTSVADIGDIDGDGLDDIAIASPGDGSGKVFIYSRKNPPASWGTNVTSWPAALTDADANYTITINTTTFGAGVMDFRCLARLGNFDGTGADDFVVALDGANSVAGAVFIVKGSSSFASRTLPDATAAYEIDGVAGSAFGYTNIGIGPFYASASEGPALVTGTFLGSSAYAFAGQAPTTTLTTTNANDSVLATTADRYGRSLGYLGPLGASPAAVTVGSLVGSYVDVDLGTISSGPFLGAAGTAPAPSIHFVDSAASSQFGGVNLGGGVKGTSRAISLIGDDAVSDLVVAGTETGHPVYIVSGTDLVTLSGTVDVSTTPTGTGIVKVSGLLPSDIGGFGAGSVVPDSNGDGYADFAIGESANSGNTGRVFVFY
jgi:hypothetical protein